MVSENRIHTIDNFSVAEVIVARAYDARREAVHQLTPQRSHASGARSVFHPIQSFEGS